MWCVLVVDFCEIAWPSQRNTLGQDGKTTLKRLEKGPDSFKDQY
jgi:hypothetical protein